MKRRVLRETYWGWRRQRASGVCALLSGRQSRLKGCLSSFRRDCRTSSSQIFFNFFFLFFCSHSAHQFVALRVATPSAQTVDIETLGKIWDPIGDEGRQGVSYVPSPPRRCYGNAEGLIHFGSVPFRPLGPHAVPLWHRATCLFPETKRIECDQITLPDSPIRLHVF